MDHSQARSSLSASLLLLGTAAVTLILSGCGGGGSSSGDVVPSSVAQAIISGNAVKGPVDEHEWPDALSAEERSGRGEARAVPM
jgi:hypothetical protein